MRGRDGACSFGSAPKRNRFSLPTAVYLGKVSLKLQQTWVVTVAVGSTRHLPGLSFPCPSLPASSLTGCFPPGDLVLLCAQAASDSFSDLTNIFVPEGHLELFKSWSPLEVQLRSLSFSRSLS